MQDKKMLQWEEIKEVIFHWFCICYKNHIFAFTILIFMLQYLLPINQLFLY